MEQPFADTKSMNFGAEEKAQLSSAISNMMKEQHGLADFALKSFSSWDKNKNEALSREELYGVVHSDEATLVERTVAGALAKNYDGMKDLVGAALPKEIDGKKFTDPGYSYLKSTFAGDTATYGISRKDLNMYSTLLSKDGKEEFLNKAVQAEKSSLMWNTAVGGIAGSIIVADLIATFAGHKGLGLLGACLAAYLTGTNGYKAFDTARKNDLPELEKQFMRRKAMLESWEMPRT